ncbi:DnaJ domain-containing protein [Paludibacterium denitrificans]|uniref:DnaJ domain-containing protein n=1 Tax=Paludibacterium denitrificans TaxID=2675226 RepID=A0A844GHX6_9NEIS|nr:DnaJ domain-containing protein [Paludibacterium denitrificans]MTD34095.1 DnaJ domain-containing protein [Paludibacterium denitrificans]
MNLYDFLGVDQSASDEQIKSAIMKKADEQKSSASPSQYDMSMIRHAIEVLQDGNKRKEYDVSLSQYTETRRIEIEPMYEQNVDYGVLLLCLPISFSGAITLMSSFVNQFFLMENMIICLFSLMVCSTGIIAAIEESKNSIKTKNDPLPPFINFLGIMLLWPYGYCSYMASRRRYGYANPLLTTIIIAIITTLLFAYPAYKAHKLKTEFKERMEKIINNPFKFSEQNKFK